jgi:SAM-dependent methyltransferase
LTQSTDGQFHELATYYDALNDWKDYRAETRRLESIVRSYGAPKRASWLDVACGTGRHLEFLGRGHPCMGVDASREMLRIARRRLPRVELRLGDMRTFRLGRRFDVVSCLFGAVGHLRTVDDIRRAFANLARHLNSGGVALVEPWILSKDFRAGSVYLRTRQGPALALARMAFSARRGNRSRVHYHFLIGERHRPVRYYEEVDEGLLLSRAQWLTLLENAGLEAHFLRRGLMPGRGLLVGVRREAT